MYLLSNILNNIEKGLAQYVLYFDKVDTTKHMAMMMMMIVAKTQNIRSKIVLHFVEGSICMKYSQFIFFFLSAEKRYCFVCHCIEVDDLALADIS